MQKFLYLFYIFLIPLNRLFNLEMPFSHLSTFVALIGVMLFLPKFNSHRLLKWENIILFCTIYTIFVAIVTYSMWGRYNGETTIDCIIGPCVFYILFGISILYNYHNLTQVITKKDLYNVLNAVSFLLLVVGYVQLAILNGWGGIAPYYDILAHISCLKDSEYLLMVDRGVTFFGAEPAAASGTLLICFPFVLMQERQKTFRWRTYAWCILMFLSGSTQTILSFLVVLVCFFITLYAKRILKYVYLLLMAGGLGMALYYSYGDPRDFQISEGTYDYLLYGKVVNFESESLRVRESTVVNDVKTFFEYPISGVGDGIQGMLFNEHLPVWIQTSPTVNAMMNGVHGVVNGGGNFFPSFLSAFGLIGIWALLLFYNRYKKDVELLENDSFWYPIFCMGLGVFLISGWQTVSLLNNEHMALLLSLPYMALHKRYYRER